MNPWEQPNVPWKTEAAFWNWVKGALRRSWSRHPIKIQYTNSKRFKAPLGKQTKKNPQGLVWACVCEHCKGTFRQSQCEVDHKHKSQTERWYDDIAGFVKRMFFITFDDIQILCKPCHAIKTYADSKDISFEEAKFEKQLIALNKNAKTQKAFLESRSIVPGKNADERAVQIREILQGERSEGKRKRVPRHKK